MDPFRSLRLRDAPPGCFLGEGIKVVRRMLEDCEVLQLLLTPEWHERLRAKIPPAAVVRISPRREMEEIVGFPLHQGVMAVGKIPPVPSAIPRGRIVALDGISHSENVGAILRSCAAFGADAVVTGPRTCSPWVRRAVRVSMAAPLVVPVFFSDDLVRTIRELGLPAYAAHIHGERTPLHEVELSGPHVLVLGGEAEGVSSEVLAVCRRTVYIPMAEGWDCINVAASAAVLLYASSLAQIRSRTAETAP